MSTWHDRTGIRRGAPIPFRVASDGEAVSGKFAIVEKSHEFTLVPWRSVMGRQIGRKVMGVVQGGSVSWQLGKARALGI